MIPVAIVVADELIDLGFKVARQVVVLQQDAVLERLMPSLDLALRHWMIGGAADVIDALLFEPVSKITRDVA